MTTKRYYESSKRDFCEKCHTLTPFRFFNGVFTIYCCPFCFKDEIFDFKGKGKILKEIKKETQAVEINGCASSTEGENVLN